MNHKIKTPFEPVSRYCPLCRVHQSTIGGYWIELNGGKNRKWVCSKHAKQTPGVMIKDVT